jgi:septal ring factor EnvC (AmiA/AmiB activator)
MIKNYKRLKKIRDDTSNRETKEILRKKIEEVEKEIENKRSKRTKLRTKLYELEEGLNE